MKTSVAAVLLALALLAHSQGAQTSPSNPHRHGSFKDPVLGAAIEENEGFRRRGTMAERKGDYAEAERQYGGFIRRVPDAPVGYAMLARLYDLWGRDRDAYGAWRRALATYEPVASSIRYPGPLARYGDLAARFGTPQEAGEAYALAVAASDRDDVWDPRPISRNGSLASLKAAAHAAAAIVDLWGGGGGENTEAAAEREINAAIAADPGYWVPYYYRAILNQRTGRRADATRDAAQAERLAPPKGRRQVRWMRAGRRIPDASGRLLAFPARRDGLSWTEPPELADRPSAAVAPGGGPRPKG